jgi:hypothetical protein
MTISKPWSQEEIDFLKNNVEKLSDKELSEHLGKSTQGIVAKKYQLKITRCPTFSVEEFLEAIKVSHNHREAKLKLGYIRNINASFKG